MALNERQKTNLLVIVFAGVLLLGGNLYYKFYFAEAQKKGAVKRAADVDKDIKAAEVELEQIKQWAGRKAEMEELKTKIEKITRRLPTSKDAPGFLAALVEVLRATGIRQQSVRPVGAQERTQYTEIPYSVSAYGRYHEVGQFLTLLEQNPDRFMRVKSFRLSNNLQRPSIHPIDMQIATFLFKIAPPPPPPSKEESAAPAAAKKKARPAKK